MFGSAERLVRVAAIGVLLVPGLGAQKRGMVRVQSLELGARAAHLERIDTDADGRSDVVIVLHGGRVRVWRGVEDGGPLREDGGIDLVLPRPRHCLLAFADLLAAGAPQLISTSPDGTVAHPLRAGAEPVTVASRARFDLRVGAPRPAEFVQDLNRDRRPDLVIPVVAHPRSRDDVFEIWTNETEPGGTPRMRRTARLPLQANRSARAAAKKLSDELHGTITIPALSAEDLNGDGRVDLLVDDDGRHSFHLQRDDGSFPADPDVAMRVETFRDTTPRAGIRPGRTLAGADRQQITRRDLDGDGIPDHVISHRRKVWVFPGTAQGPQFTEPSMILKTADDITAFLVARLDDDERPDLLIIKVEVPSVATMVGALIAEWDIDVNALGYASDGGRKFHTVPQWKATVTIRLPSILGVMRDPEALLGRFEDVGRAFRRELSADVDGDGEPDVLLVSEDRARLDLWLRVGRRADAGPEHETLLRRVLFDGDDQVWDIDRILKLLLSHAEERVRALSGGTAADASVDLRDPARFTIVDLGAADLDGDGAAEIVLQYETTGPESTTVVDVLRWE